MGRANKLVFEYNLEGKYIRRWNSENDFRNNYYSDDLGKRPIFVDEIKGFKYHITHNETIALLERPGRDFIKLMVRIYKSDLCNFYENKGSEKPIQMFNLKDELLAEFGSIVIAEKLTNIPRETIGSQLKRGNKKTKGLTGDFYFEYKN